MTIYSDSRLLEEYEIIKEVLQITSVQNISHAVVKFAFRRRIEYHLTSTFMQVLITRLIFQDLFSRQILHVTDNGFGPHWLFIILF